MISKKGYKVLTLIKQGKYQEAITISKESQIIEYFIELKYIEVYADMYCQLLARGEEALENYIDSKLYIKRSNIKSIISLAISGLALISSILVGILF